MKLVYDDTQEPVAIGDTLHREDGNLVVTGFRKPHKAASSGFVWVKNSAGNEHQYYVSVIGATWINREDRE